jgi:predicted DNA-binding transcriptional regulator YafY
MPATEPIIGTFDEVEANAILVGLKMLWDLYLAKAPQAYEATAADIGAEAAYEARDTVENAIRKAMWKVEAILSLIEKEENN